MTILEGHHRGFSLDEPKTRQLFHEQADCLPSTIHTVSMYDDIYELYALLSLPSLAVIGPRRATPYGMECATKLTTHAASLGATIVTGGALGVQTAALEAALQADGRAVVILGQGLGTDIYPAQNAELIQSVIDHGGAVLSVYKPDNPPLPKCFQERNKLIAAFANAMLVCEAGLPSGTMTTAEEALALGKPVLAVPGSIFEPASYGCNRLIEAGAQIVTGFETISNALRR